MDPLCHTLVGAALARSGLERRTTRATAALVLGANLPDVDVLAAFTDHALGFRRGITHGLPAMLILPLVLTGCILLWDRWRRGPRDVPRAVPRQVLLLAVLATLTHPFLDWLNVYGMRWLMPFDGTWFYGDSVFIVDPWLWLVLAVGWSLAGRTVAGRPAYARWALGVAGLYIVVMVGVTVAGRRVAERELGLDRAGPGQLQVAPPFLASWRREVIVDVGDGYRFGEVVWGRPSAVRLHPGMLDKGLDIPEVPGVVETVPLRHLRDWGRFLFATVEPGPGGPVIRFDDARYTTNGPSFAAVRVPQSPTRSNRTGSPGRR